MTQREMTRAHITAHIITLMEDMVDMVKKDEWEQVGDLASEIRGMAVKQMMNDQSRKAARYGKR